MRRSLALIAVGAAVAAAAVVVVAGTTSGRAGGTSDAPGTTAVSALPSGHPSIAATGEATTTPVAASGVEDAITGLEKKSAGDPSDVGALLDLGDAYFLGQRLQQAQRAYAGVLELEPGNAAAQVGLALVWHAQGDSKKAETALRSVLGVHPDDQKAHYSLAIVYFSTGRVDKAKAEWQTAARIDPTSTTGLRSQSFVDLLEDQQSAAPHAED